MRDPTVFNFVPDPGDELDNEGVRGSHGDTQVEPPAFEPTRDGWRAYQAWCKQIRDEWDTDD